MFYENGRRRHGGSAHSPGSGASFFSSFVLLHQRRRSRFLKWKELQILRGPACFAVPKASLPGRLRVNVPVTALAVRGRLRPSAVPKILIMENQVDGSPPVPLTLGPAGSQRFLPGSVSERPWRRSMLTKQLMEKHVKEASGKGALAPLMTGSQNRSAAPGGQLGY